LSRGSPSRDVPSRGIDRRTSFLVSLPPSRPPVSPVAGSLLFYPGNHRYRFFLLYAGYGGCACTSAALSLGFPWNISRSRLPRRTPRSPGVHCVPGGLSFSSARPYPGMECLTFLFKASHEGNGGENKRNVGHGKVIKTHVPRFTIRCLRIGVPFTYT